MARGADHRVGIEIADAVGIEIFADLIHRALVREQVLRIGKIDAVMAGEPVRGTTDPHVDFRRARLAHVHHARPRGRAAHDRIVHDDHALPGDRFLDQIQLHPHVEIADELGGLKKRAADVMIAHEGVAVRNPELLREPERGVISRIRHGHHEVSFDGMQPRQFAPHFASALLPR